MSIKDQKVSIESCKERAEEKEQLEFRPATRESHVETTCQSRTLVYLHVQLSFHLHLLNTHAQTRTPHSCNHHSQNVRKDVSTRIPRIHPRQSLGSQRQHCRCAAGCRSRCRYRRQGMHREMHKRFPKCVGMLIKSSPAW